MSRFLPGQNNLYNYNKNDIHQANMIKGIYKLGMFEFVNIPQLSDQAGLYPQMLLLYTKKENGMFKSSKCPCFYFKPNSEARYSVNFADGCPRMHDGCPMVLVANV